MWIDTAAARALAAKLEKTSNPSRFLRTECARLIRELADTVDRRPATSALPPLASALAHDTTAARLSGLSPGAYLAAPAFVPGRPGPSDLRSWAAWVLAEAAQVPPWSLGSDKRFISDLWARLGTRAAPSLQAFKERLFQAHQARLLSMSRADLVEAMPPDKVAVSEFEYLGSTWHFVRVPDPLRPWG